MRRAWAAVLVALLVATPAGARPGHESVQRSTKWFLHIGLAGTGTTGEWTHTLDERDYADTGNGTGNLYNGIGNEIFPTAGREPERTVFEATDGLPLRLGASDPATNPVTGQIAVRTLDVGSFEVSVPVGAGMVVLELDLTGVPAGSGERVVIASQVIEFLVTPFQSRHVLDVRMAPDGSFDGVAFTDVSLTTHFRGPSVGTGFFELDDPASFIEVPTLRSPRTR